MASNDLSTSHADLTQLHDGTNSNAWTNSMDFSQGRAVSNPITSDSYPPMAVANMDVSDAAGSSSLGGICEGSSYASASDMQPTVQ